MRIELTDHHEKWKEYQSLISLLKAQEDRETNIVGNDVPQDEEAIQKLREEMNMQHRAVDRNYQRLKEKVLRRGQDGEFQDHRVRVLWKRVQAQGLSKEELEIMKACSSLLGNTHCVIICSQYILGSCMPPNKFRYNSDIAVLELC